VYQRYQNWAFDEELQGHRPNVRAFLSDSTRLRKLLQPAASPSDNQEVNPNPASAVRQAVEQELIGRIEIPRLKVHAIVREGDDDGTLRRAVGHIPSSALPGHTGNVALAGHRDTFFRALRDVRKNDKIDIRTLNGDYEYVVENLRIVAPDDVQVLAPTSGNVLTLVTCYPFNYVGNAPKRYIVRARQVGESSVTATAITQPASSTP
jgi:sortase A